jgi:fatty acid desaturase
VIRSDAESTVIVLWIVLGLLLLAAVLYDASGAGDWPLHLLVLVVGELLLAGLARAAIAVVRRR